MSGRSSASSAHRAIAARLLALVVLGTAALAVWGELTAQGDGELSVVFLNVGQGDAVLITAPNRTQVLIDGGADGARVLRELGAVLPFWDRSIDVVLATHPDADHIGGLPAVFARFSVSHALTSGAESDTDLDEALLGAIAAEGAAHTHARRGGRVVLDEEAGVVLEILYPDRSVADDADTNDASIVARLVYGEREFLFTGDVSRDVEEYLLWLDSDS
ncbi:MBL fold metallo-hydrolase, partial [Patescibacteria group bacterium]|nr:MBL fold metallo-hydrolase [Patescibacteria group bacterium]